MESAVIFQQKVHSGSHRLDLLSSQSFALSDQVRMQKGISFEKFSFHVEFSFCLIGRVCMPIKGRKGGRGAKNLQLAPCRLPSAHCAQFEAGIVFCNVIKAQPFSRAFPQKQRSIENKYKLLDLIYHGFSHILCNNAVSTMMRIAFSSSPTFLTIGKTQGVFSNYEGAPEINSI